MSDFARDALEQMRAGVDAAHQAAEKLMREAESEAIARAKAAEERVRAQTGGMPAGGWATPGAGARSDDEDWLRALVRLLDLAREIVRPSVPPELAAQIAEAVRQLLLAVRALIDWYLERLDARGQPGPPSERPVEDIPIL